MTPVSRDRGSPDKHYIGNVKECIVSMITALSTDLESVVVGAVDLLLQRTCSAREEHSEGVGHQVSVLLSSELVLWREDPLEPPTIPVLKVFPRGVFPYPN